MIRFYNYTILTGAGRLLECVVETLNNSYVGMNTALSLLSALADEGERFEVLCEGDFNTIVRSQECDCTTERGREWLEQIKNALDIENEFRYQREEIISILRDTPVSQRWNMLPSNYEELGFHLEDGYNPFSDEELWCGAMPSKVLVSPEARAVMSEPIW